VKLITKEQENEYKLLKNWAKREGVYESAREISNLEDDIDKPIKKCVAMVALLGLKPIYSCCGFDYSGQPFHKSHQYGEPYIMLSVESEKYRSTLFNDLQQWVFKKSPANKDISFLTITINDSNGNPYWRNKNCIHFPEECVFAISYLEKYIFQYNSLFLDEIVVNDTNNNAKKSYKYWQYPPKKSWVVSKSELELY
jgi:hypothetical protein